MSSMKSMKFSVVATNQYGNCCYTPDIKGTITLDEISEQDFYTIKNPDDLTIDGAIKRRYNGVEYLLSAKASSVIGEDGSGGGALVAVKFGDYYVLVADNKFYWMPCGGGMEDGETPKQTALRELNEELRITGITENQLQLMGTMAYQFKNSLVEDASWAKITYMYYLELDFDKGKHLIPNGKELDNINIFSAAEYDFELDEQEMVMIIKSGHISEVETTVNGKSFDGHHRKTMLILDKAEHDHINPSYLLYYKIE